MQNRARRGWGILVTSATVQALVAVAFGLPFPPLAAGAQQPTKVPRIGYLLARSPADAADITNAFLQGLRDHGYVDCQTIAIEYRWTHGRFEQLPDLAADLVRLKVDVIVTGGEAAIRAARQATSTIPIVMATAPDPVGSGLIASLAHPGGNLTGLSILATEVAAKRLELLKETIPKLSRVAVLWNPGNPAKVREMKETEDAARALGLTLRPVQVRGLNDFNSAFSAITRERPDGLVTLVESLTLTHRRRIADFAAKRRLPMIAELRQFAEAGGLMTYGASQSDLFRRAATYVDKILKGAKPADLPVEQPMRFELVINMKTAKALDLTIPQTVLIRVDQVIQ